MDSTTTMIEIDKNILLAQIDPKKMDDGGFNVFSKPFISQKSVHLLRNRLEKVFQGEYSTGNPPTKTPSELSSSSKIKSKNSSSSSSSKNKSVIHMINISKADVAFQQLALNPAIGEAVAKVMKWPSVKFAQDQVWCKPPGGSSALSFHRDSPYFDMIPQDVATLWITLDDLSYEENVDNDVNNHDQEKKKQKNPLGPLEYCFGSHKWGQRDNDGDRAVGARTGSASQFFDPDYYALLRSAAQREADACNREEDSNNKITKNKNNNNDDDDVVDDEKFTMMTEAKDLIRIEVVVAGAGGGSIHNGRTFHGSGPNVTENQFRRGIGIHYVRGDAKFKTKKVTVLKRKTVRDESDGTEREVEVEVEEEVLKLGKLWEPLKAPDGSTDLIELHFPTIYKMENESGGSRREKEEEYV
jgi:phytanoyl-CoA hydroxylase